jgi:hypothetical protein
MWRLYTHYQEDLRQGFCGLQLQQPPMPKRKQKIDTITPVARFRGKNRLITKTGVFTSF